jgi:kelch-like protein 20
MTRDPCPAAAPHPPPRPRSPPSGAPAGPRADGALGGQVYAAGGWEGAKYLRSVEAFDPSASTWVRAPPMAAARGSFGLCAAGDALVAAGGFDGHGHLVACERLRVAPSAQAAPAGHAAHAAAPAGNGTAGGAASAGPAPSAGAEAWEALPPLGTARSGLRLAAVGGAVFAAGGYNGSAVLATVERLDPAGARWVPVAPMLSPRRDFALEVALPDPHFARNGF